MSHDILTEARRQVEICNACRYCEGYCAVFPAITRERAFADADITQLANLCHNCRGCYYACQYAPPHDFALNLPQVLAEVRQDSWQRTAWPAGFAGLFHRSGVVMALFLVASIGLAFWAVATLPGGGEGFYAALGHTAMISIFGPAFLLPLLALGIGVRRYWIEIGGGPISRADLRDAFEAAARMTNLSGGQGQGCNYEKEDRYSNARRHAHQAVMWGFVLCFAATCVATLMHYVLGWSAPYPVWSPPKLLGITGGVLLVTGCAGLVWLKTRADRNLGAPALWGGEMAFILLLGLTGFTGLVLWAASGTGAVPPLLAVHLATVFTLFLLTPYSKMVHGAYRLAALLRDAQLKRG